jgi:hypothetical protein
VPFPPTPPEVTRAALKHLEETAAPGDRSTVRVWYRDKFRYGSGSRTFSGVGIMPVSDGTFLYVAAEHGQDMHGIPVADIESWTWRS